MLTDDAARRLVLLATHLGAAPSPERLRRAAGIVRGDDALGVLLVAAAGGSQGMAAFDEVFGVLREGGAEHAGWGLLDLVGELAGGGARAG